MKEEKKKMAGSKITIRDANEKDLTSLVKLFTNVKEVKDYVGAKHNKSYFKAYIDAHGRALFVAEIDGVVLGAMNLEYERGEYLFLNNVVVSKVARGKGVGGALMKYMESFAKKNKIKRILLFVYKWNKQMQKVVEHYNYVHNGELFLYSKKM